MKRIISVFAIIGLLGVFSAKIFAQSTNVYYKHCDGKMNIAVDFRYPSTLPGSFIEEAAEKIGAHTMLGKHQRPLFNSKESFLIKTLLKVYNEETNSNLQPMAIGGGTYARALPIGAAFGPEFPGEDAPVHEPNEYITVENIIKMAGIYKRAIKELMK